MTGRCKECRHYTKALLNETETEFCGWLLKPIDDVSLYCNSWSSKDKPPLGVKPSFLTAESRISDLAEAILRYTEGGCTKHGYEQIKTFAKEIYLQSDLALQMEGENHVYQSRDL